MGETSRAAASGACVTMMLLSSLGAGCDGSGVDTSATRGDAPTDSSVSEDTAPADTGDPPAPLPYNGCTRPDGLRAAGTLQKPMELDGFPFTDAASSVDAPEDAVDRYDCAEATAESGAERWYRFELDAPRDVRIDVSDGSGVDVDIHLLQDPSVTDGTAYGCVERDDAAITRNLGAGTWWIAVDTYASTDGTEYPGAYRLAVESWEDGVWTDIVVAEGVTWRHRQSGGTDPQRVDAVFIDAARATVEPVRHDGCERVPDVAARVGARIGMNAAFYDESCDPRTFLRIDGETLYTPDLGSQQRAALWDAGTAPTFRCIPADGDDTSHAHGIGSYPSLRTEGARVVDPDGTSSFFTARHPRSGLGVDAQGRIALVVVDGRSDAAGGLTMDELADLLGTLGLTDAVNLDGGGSSTLYIEGCSVTGVVNFPSDGGGDAHDGARSVADGVYVWSEC